MKLTSVQKGSLVKSAVTQLRAGIEAGNWRLGQKIPVESELAERLGVSRNTIREAVRVLVHAGMLESRQGAGTYVRALVDPAETLRRMDSATLRDRFEVRLTLEVEAARLAAQRHDSHDLAAMRETLNARAAHPTKSETEDFDSFIDIDARFHYAIVAASHNRALTDLYRYCATAILDTIRHTELDRDLPEPGQSDHAALLHAIEARDAEGAARATRALLAGSLDALARSSLPETGEVDPG